MHRRQCEVGGLSGTTFPAGKSPLYGETFRAVLVACKQHGMGARVQGRRFSHQPSGFEPGATHRALAADRCCGGRHGADAQNGTAVSRARPPPRAHPVGGTAPEAPSQQGKPGNSGRMRRKNPTKEVKIRRHTPRPHPPVAMKTGPDPLKILPDPLKIQPQIRRKFRQVG